MLNAFLLTLGIIGGGMTMFQAYIEVLKENEDEKGD